MASNAFDVVDVYVLCRVLYHVLYRASRVLWVERCDMDNILVVEFVAAVEALDDVCPCAFLPFPCHVQFLSDRNVVDIRTKKGIKKNIKRCQ